MYVRGRITTEQIVNDSQRYELKGKADLVMQNNGETEVQVGNRILEVGETIRLAGELTILTNDSIVIRFIGLGAKSLWIHYIVPSTILTHSPLSQITHNDESC